MTTCEPCNGSGEVAISNSTLDYRGPGPVPDYARGVIGVKCGHCNGSGEQPDPRDLPWGERETA